MVHSDPAIRFTYEDYRNTPDEKRYELLDGELPMVPAPNLHHQRVAARLGARLVLFVEGRGLGEVFPAPCDVVLSDTDVVQPDLLFVARERERILHGGDNVRGAPDLVIEILAPSTAERDRTLKRDLYARHGVREYWLVDTVARTVTVMLLVDEGFEVAARDGEGQTLTSPTLPGFRVDLDDIF
jgi:Uma2 family endonuclease